MLGRESCRHSRSPRRTQGGAVAVEFALILPVLAMLIIGIVTFGFAFNDQLALTNTVREGARFGGSTDNTAAWGSAVQSRTVDLYFNSESPLQGGQTCALLISRESGSDTIEQSSNGGCATGGTPAGPIPATPGSVSDGQCFVKVWAAKPATLNWVLFRTQVTLRAKSVSIYNRDLSCPD